jgi:hypothetical protein
VKRRKARRAATHKSARPVGGDLKLGGKDRHDAIPDPIQMKAVYDGQQCCGFIYSRGPRGIEAYNADQISLGIFLTAKAAADAICAARGNSFNPKQRGTNK